MKLQSFNYHTHSFRSGHGVGTEEEYIKAAIEAGFKTIGYSEHMAFPDWEDPNERIPNSEMNEYLETVYALKEKYKNQINIRVGFESEYWNDVDAYLRGWLNKCEYMLLGQHNYARDERAYHFGQYATDQYITEYGKQVIAGMKSGIFHYLAHPDYWMYDPSVTYSKTKEEVMYEVAKCAKENDIVMEINLKGSMLGLHDYPGYTSYRYPNDKTVELMAAAGAKVCFGYDAHYPNALIDYRKMEEVLHQRYEHLKLNFVEDLEL